MKLTKKQKELNKKEKHKLTKSYAKQQARKEIKLKDKEWQLAVKERDEFKCAICGRTDILHVHHLIPREDKLFRWLIENGVTLCPLHHKYSLEISAHRNAFAFYIWFINNRVKQYLMLLDHYNKIYKPLIN